MDVVSSTASGMTVTSAHDDWFRRVPKVELHVHLEGAIPYATLWELLGKYGGDPSVPDQEALIRKFAYRDFRHFIETWNWKNGFLREYEDFTIIAEAVARDLARQNVRYVEAFYSPPDFRRHGLQTQRVTAAIRSGLDRVPEIEIALVADLVRNSALPAAARTLQEIRDVQDLGVVGIGLGGPRRASRRSHSRTSTRRPAGWASTPPPTQGKRQDRRASGGRFASSRWSAWDTAPAPRRTTPCSTIWRNTGLNGIRVSWLPDERKRELSEDFRNDPDW